MSHNLDIKRIGLFVALAFGLAWAIGLVIFLTGGLVNSPVLVPQMQLTLAAILLAGGYMWAPGLAHLLTRLLTREGWQDTWLRPHFKRGWRFWLAAWVMPALCTVVGAAAFFALQPGYFDPDLTMLRGMLAQNPQTAAINPWLVVAAQLGSAILIAPLVNGLFTFGEEFGWRGYLLPKLLPLGERRALLISGVIWGVWHWPVIAMGHNYGFGYAGAPWTGMLLMVWFTVVTGVFLGWVTLRAGSVWPAVIGHAAINGISALGVLFLQGTPSSLLGPLPVGLLGSLGWAAAAVWIWRRVQQAPRDEQAGAG